jgi:ABC-type sugar transport system ATPase subunit
VRRALELRNVTVSHSRTPVIDGLSLDVAAGEVVAIAGEPGFGGSMLARIVAGIRRPDAGDVLIGGRIVTDEPPETRRVGLVAAGGGLLPHLTARENIHYARRIGRRGWYGERYVVEQRIDGLVAEMGLEPLLDQRSDRLSPGQRFRVGVARALARSPQVLVVDATAGAEQVHGLRELLTDAVRALRNAIARCEIDTTRAPPAAQLAIVICTSQPAAVAAGDRLIVLAGGRVQVDGRPADLRSAPSTVAIARLVYPEGLPTVLGTVTGEEIVGPVRLPCPPGLQRPGTVLVGLPAAALSLGRPPDGIAGRVIEVRPGHRHARVTFAPDALPGERWPVRVPSQQQPRMGARVAVTVSPDRVLVFDHQAGQLLTAAT